MQEETNMWADAHWGKEGQANLLESLNQVTLMTSSRALQGPEVRSRFTKEFADLYNDLDRALGFVSFMFPHLPIPVNRRRDVAREKISKLYKAIIERRLQETGVEYDDLIATLMDATYPDGSHVTPDEIVGFCIALLLAGQHTSNVTSTWTLLYILSNPDIKERVLAELEEVWPVADKDSQLTYDQVRRLEFLNCCVKETLRMRPPIIMVFRKTEVEWKFKEYVLPADSLVVVSPAVANRDPSVWTNPDSYDPDRFGKDRAEDKKAKYASLAFSAGRHACIGEQFAYMQVMSILSTMLRKYEFEPVGKASELEPDYAYVAKVTLRLLFRCDLHIFVISSTMIVAPKVSDVKYKLREC
jgi:sterol 14-demethylase